MKTWNHIKNIFWKRLQTESSQVESWKIVPKKNNTTPVTAEHQYHGDVTTPAQDHMKNAEAQEFRLRRNTCKNA